MVGPRGPWPVARGWSHSHTAGLFLPLLRPASSTRRFLFAVMMRYSRSRKTKKNYLCVFASCCSLASRPLHPWRRSCTLPLPTTLRCRIGTKSQAFETAKRKEIEGLPDLAAAAVKEELKLSRADLATSVIESLG